MEKEITSNCSTCKGRGWLNVTLDGYATTCPLCNGTGDEKNPAVKPIKFVATYDYGVMSEDKWKILVEEEKKRKGEKKGGE